MNSSVFTIVFLTPQTATNFSQMEQRVIDHIHHAKRWTDEQRGAPALALERALRRQGPGMLFVR